MPNPPLSQQLGRLERARWLRHHDEEIVGLVIHPEAHRRFGDEILRTLKLPPQRVSLGDQLRDPETLAQLRNLRPDIGISAFFAFILRPELFEIFPHGCINLHSGYLPFNRGWHTNVWPIIDGSSAGATVHYVDTGVDTGDVISQRRFPVDLTDTGGVLHEKITRGLIELFKDTWPRIKDGSVTRTAQNHSKATHHRKGDLGVIDQIHLDRHYRAADLLNLLRARTYPPYPVAYAIEDGRRRYYHINYATRPQRNERATDSHSSRNSQDASSSHSWPGRPNRSHTPPISSSRSAGSTPASCLSMRLRSISAQIPPRPRITFPRLEMMAASEMALAKAKA